MSYHLSPIGNSAQIDANGNPLSGGKIYTYVAGTSTAATTYTDDSGATAQANPILLNTLGLPASPIWLQGGVTYKFVINDANDVLIRTVDDISGINDVTGSLDQWVTYSNAPTYISATSFSVVGDQTGAFQVGRRLKSTVTAGTIYSTISASSFAGGITTVTVANDSGTLDAGLSLVSYGLVSVSNSSLPRSIVVSSINGGQLAGTRNKIINGSMAVAQRGTSFTAGANNDDAYLLDRWYVLSDGNDVVDVTQESTTVPTGGQYAIALDVETVNKKFGIAQIIERSNCDGLLGNTVTLSFKAKVSATTKLDNVKCAIVAWSGTADSVTSDIVSAWNVEGTNPTLIANATYENTPANLNLTTSYATYSVTAAVDTASAANIIVFIWSDVTDTTLGHFLYITDVQLEAGSVATPFEHRFYGVEHILCERYLPAYKSAGTVDMIGCGEVTGATEVSLVVTHRVRPRVAPTGATVSSASHFTLNAVTGSAAASSVTLSSGGLHGTRMIFGSSGLTAGQACEVYANSTSGSILFTGCEL